MRFIDDCFPLIVMVSAPKFDAAEVRAMMDGFETYFQRGEKYAVLSLTPRNAPVPEQAERKMLGEWMNQPRVRDYTKRLCVGSATLIANPLTRAAYSIIMAFGRPAAPNEAVPTVERGLDYCLERIREAGLATPRPAGLIRYELLRELRDVT
jgi:hypothetical protein